MTRKRTVASFTYPGPNPAFFSIDEMEGDIFNVYVRGHAPRIAGNGPMLSLTIDGNNMRAFVRELKANTLPRLSAKARKAVEDHTEACEALGGTKDRTLASALRTLLSLYSAGVPEDTTP